MKNPWNKLSQLEKDEFWELIKKVNRWTTYCAMMRSHKPPKEIDYSFDLPNEEFIRWDFLAQKMWNGPLA